MLRILFIQILLTFILKLAVFAGDGGDVDSSDGLDCD
jgi:hypothetical protein